MSHVCDFGRREGEQCWERAGSVAKWSPWDSANLPRRKECRAGEMQSAAICGCSSTPASPSSAGPEPPPRPLSPTQLPAPRHHRASIPSPVSWLHSGWKPPKLGTCSLFGHQASLNFVCLGPRGRCVRERRHRGGNCWEGCFSLIYSSYYLQQTEVSKNPRPSICHLPPTDKYSSLAHLFFFF